MGWMIDIWRHYSFFLWRHDSFFWTKRLVKELSDKTRQKFVWKIEPKGNYRPIHLWSFNVSTTICLFKRHLSMQYSCLYIVGSWIFGFILGGPYVVCHMGLLCHHRCLLNSIKCFAYIANLTRRGPASSSKNLLIAYNMYIGRGTFSTSYLGQKTCL